NWKQLKGNIKEQWGKLTDDDLAAAEGNYDQLIGRIQERYGYSREESERRLNDFLAARSRDMGFGRASTGSFPSRQTPRTFIRGVLLLSVSAVRAAAGPSACEECRLLASGMADPGSRVDLGADAGESFGRWSVVDESALFPHLTSVHLACGFHAGDPAGLRRSISRAMEFGLALGAHPGYPDLVGFGRRSMSVSTDELFADVVYQLG